MPKLTMRFEDSPRVQTVRVGRNYGSHLHIWPGDTDYTGRQLEIYWKPLPGGLELKFIPAPGATEPPAPLVLQVRKGALL